MFAVRSIQVEGASPALAVEVRAELRSFDGRSLVAVNGDAVEQRVDGLAAVRASVVDRSFPHTLRVRVIPELPVATYQPKLIVYGQYVIPSESQVRIAVGLLGGKVPERFDSPVGR